MNPSTRARLERLQVSVYRVPTDAPEADGTLDWDATTMVLVETFGGGRSGLGYTYAGASAATLIHQNLEPMVVGMDCLDLPRAWNAMVHEIRNLGRPGVASSAISAVDIALWDLKAKLLDLPLVQLRGRARSGIPVYGSGGFTSYTSQELAAQLGGWAREGIAAVKMKIGRDPARDPERVRVAREAIGPGVALFVDANGAHHPKQALAQARAFAPYQVTWFEEPVSSDDLAGLRLVRENAPAGMDIAAGEYGYDAGYFRQMLAAGAVDVLQADATRCGGITGFLQAAELAEAFHIPFSAHTAPAIHLHPCCAVRHARHLEYFHDHARIEQMFFEGVQPPQSGELVPDLSRPGLGLELKRADAGKFQTS